MLTQTVMSMAASMLTGTGMPNLANPPVAPATITSQELAAPKTDYVGTHGRFHSEKMSIDRPGSPSHLQPASQLKLE